MDFIVLWEARDNKQNIIYGQQNICNVTFLTPNTSEQSFSENNSLRFSVESSRKVIHDFNSNCICVVPVIFHISNSSVTNSLTFYLETLRPHDQFDTQQSGRSNSLSLQKRSQYFWTGMTQHYIRDLEPGQKIEIETTACFCRPGVYNLNRYKFNIKDVKKRGVIQQVFSNSQHLIVIEEE